MKNAFYITLFFCLSFPLFSQSTPYFELTLNEDMVVNDGYKIIKTDSLYTIAGRGIESNQQQNSFLFQIDSFGDTINTHLYQYENKNVILRDICKTNNGYAITGEATDSISNYERVYIFLLLTDSLGNVLLFKDLGTTNYSTGRCILANADGSFIIGSTAYINGHKELYCLKVAADGTIIWQYIDTTYTNTNYFTNILPDNQGGYYLYGSVNQYPYGLVSTGDLLLLHLNANGQMIDQHTYSIGETDYSGDIVRSSDGGFLLGAAHVGEETDTWDLPEGGVIKINADYSLGWINDSMYLGSGASALIELADGSIITTGSTQPPIPNAYVNLAIVKIAADGAPMWSRQYGGQWHDYGYDLALSPDGGFIAVGRKDSAVVQTAFLYIVKTNCMGLLTLPQASFVTQIDTGALRASFYNTSQFVYPDSIDGGHYLWHFGDGNTSTQANPTHTYTQGGNYTVTLTAVVCSDTSVFVQEVSTWAVDVNNNTLNDKISKLYPNPSSSAITFTHSLGNNESATCTIYDASGRLVNSISFNGSGTQTIDVANYSSGLYYYTISVNTAIIARSKLVIIK